MARTVSTTLLWLTSAFVLAAGCSLDDRDFDTLRSEVGSASGSNAAGEAVAPTDEAAGRDGGAGGAPTAGSTATSGGSASEPTGGNTGGSGAAGFAGAALDPDPEPPPDPDAGPCGDLNLNGVDDCVETLAQNTRFELDIAAWVAEPQSSSSWDARDARGKAGSGSLLFTNAAPPNADIPVPTMLSAMQCLTVRADVDYTFAARTRVLSESGGQAALNVAMFGHDNCDGGFVEAVTVAMSSQVHVWEIVRGSLKISASARSMRVRLAAVKPFPDASLTVLFDDLLVTETNKPAP